MSTQTMPEPADLLSYRAASGRPPYHFESVAAALEFVTAELAYLDAANIAVINPAEFHARVRQCGLLAAECGRLHSEWEARNPAQKEAQA